MEESTIHILRTHLRRLRKRHNLSQERFAELADIDYKFYQRIEAGRRTELRISTLERLAKVYGAKAYQLLAPKLPKTTVKNIPPKKKRRGKKKV